VTMSERPTPITDSALIQAGTCMTQEELRAGFVKADFARRLERVAGELAERLAGHVGRGCMCDHCQPDREALAEWDKMQKELT